ANSPAQLTEGQVNDSPVTIERVQIADEQVLLVLRVTEVAREARPPEIARIIAAGNQRKRAGVWTPCHATRSVVYQPEHARSHSPEEGAGGRNPSTKHRGSVSLAK